MLRKYNHWHSVFVSELVKEEEKKCQMHLITMLSQQTRLQWVSIKELVPSTKRRKQLTAVLRDVSWLKYCTVYGSIESEGKDENLSS